MNKLLEERKKLKDLKKRNRTKINQKDLEKKRFKKLILKYYSLMRFLNL